MDEKFWSYMIAGVKLSQNYLIFQFAQNLENFILVRKIYMYS
jgi:hypothetical protein